jgi:ribosomal peptide maturation radical SAM protein 1
MFKIVLINMPFASCVMPSIALSQLRAVVETELAGRATVRIAYVCHDIADYVGIDRYRCVSNSMQALNCGFGDWFFRHTAFPELPDNVAAYSMRYLRSNDESNRMLRELIEKYRSGLDGLLDGLIDHHELHKADLVGFTSMFMQNVASLAMARKLKQRNPGIITVVGGANCEYPMGKILAQRAPHIDAVFSGPALKSFPRFVDACIVGKREEPIPGVITQENADLLGQERIYGEELSIDTLIPTRYDDFFERFDATFGGTPYTPVLPFETSRGCWWGQRAHCTFCGLNGASMGYRSMNAGLARDQFQSMFAYSGRVRVLEAVDNIMPKNYLQEVLPYLETPESMEIFYEVKADLSEEDMAVLAKARVKRIQPGIEALATSTLKLMKKGTSAFQNIQFLKNCSLHGITPSWNLLVGFPGEKAEVYQRYLEVMPLLTHLEPPSGVYPVRFDRFSPYHKLSAEYGLNLRANDYYTMIYPLSQAELQDFAYYFTDQNFTADYFVSMVTWLGRMQAAVRDWEETWKAPGGDRPRLYFTGEPGQIFDSRSGTPALHDLSEEESTVLAVLAKPTRREDIARSLPPALASETVDACVAALRERGLLFEEGDRMLSLVLAADHGAGELATLGLSAQSAAVSTAPAAAEPFQSA